MAVMHAARALGFALGIEAEDDLHDLAPVGSFFCGIQEPQIGLKMALVIGSDVRLVGRVVVKRRDGHDWTPESFYALDVRRPWSGLMTGKELSTASRPLGFDRWLPPARLVRLPEVSISRH